MQADRQTNTEVRAVIRGLVKAHLHGQINEILNFFSREKDVVIIGTARDERRQGIAAVKKQLRCDLKGSNAYSMEIRNVGVSRSGNVAWLAADCRRCRARGKRPQVAEARLTVVLEKRGGTWRICQWHKSKPVMDGYVSTRRADK